MDQCPLMWALYIILPCSPLYRWSWQIRRDLSRWNRSWHTSRSPTCGHHPDDISSHLAEIKVHKNIYDLKKCLKPHLFRYGLASIYGVITWCRCQPYDRTCQIWTATNPNKATWSPEISREQVQKLTPQQTDRQTDRQTALQYLPSRAFGAAGDNNMFKVIYWQLIGFIWSVIESTKSNCSH